MFPLAKRVRTTSDSTSFEKCDLKTWTEIPIGSHPGAFGVERKNHIHEGVDLYALPGDRVYVMRTGTVVAVFPFTGEHVGMPWWNNTWAVAVDDGTCVIVYGELIPRDNRVGETVFAGQCIGDITPVLKKDKGRPTSMLHVEVWKPGIVPTTILWQLGEPQPSFLLDPTPLILEEMP